MKTKYLDSWLKALTSGEYRQTTGALGREVAGVEGFCCLGVLCDVLLDFDEVPVVLDPRLEGDRTITFNGGEGGVLPRDVRKFLGFSHSIPDYSFDVDAGSDIMSQEEDANGCSTWVYLPPYDERGVKVNLGLAELNDTGFTFTQIADIIRWGEAAE